MNRSVPRYSEESWIICCRVDCDDFPLDLLSRLPLFECSFSRLLLGGWPVGCEHFALCRSAEGRWERRTDVLRRECSLLVAFVRHRHTHTYWCCCYGCISCRCYQPSRQTRRRTSVTTRKQNSSGWSGLGTMFVSTSLSVCALFGAEKALAATSNQRASDGNGCFCYRWCWWCNSTIPEQRWSLWEQHCAVMRNVAICLWVPWATIMTVAPTNAAT